MITARIDMTLVDQSKLFTGKARPDGTCPKYLNVVLLESKQTQYGDWRDDNTHMIVQDASKEERAAGKRGAILGNAQDRNKRRTNDKPPTDPNDHLPSTEGDGDDIPF